MLAILTVSRLCSSAQYPSKFKCFLFADIYLPLQFAPHLNMPLHVLACALTRALFYQDPCGRFLSSRAFRHNSAVCLRAPPPPPPSLFSARRPHRHRLQCLGSASSFDFSVWVRPLAFAYFCQSRRAKLLQGDYDVIGGSERVAHVTERKLERDQTRARGGLSESKGPYHEK
jgi:hypothetical protein